MSHTHSGMDHLTQKINTHINPSSTHYLPQIPFLVHTTPFTTLFYRPINIVIHYSFLYIYHHLYIYPLLKHYHSLFFPSYKHFAIIRSSPFYTTITVHSSPLYSNTTINTSDFYANITIHIYTKIIPIPPLL